MFRRMLNRQGQRYLVRRAAPPPVVGIPGPDLFESADWSVEEASVPETYHLVSSTEPRRWLRIENGALAYDDRRPTQPGPGSWALQDVDDGTRYRYVVDANDPGRGLALAGTDGTAGNDLEVVLRPGRDRGAMWLLDEGCVADARSIHLRYQAPSGLAMFYNEVRPEEAPPGTFFCTSGFGADPRGPAPRGYAGIQHRPDGTRRAIFSIWHRMADEVHPVPGAQATTVGANPAAIESPFSGEGSGSSIRLPLAWQEAPDDPIRLVVTAEALGDDTLLTAYVASSYEPWTSLGSIVRASTGGLLMSHPYAFIEDFARTGNAPGVAAAERSPFRMRSARFVNPWCSAAPHRERLLPVTEAKFTVFSPHPLENLSARLSSEAEFSVRMATGTSSAAEAPPIGATFTDPGPHNRRPPELSGVPIA